MGLTSWDDYPVHQASELIAHPATSDRNFYDRYYFNLHPCSGDFFAIFGFGVYPNLGVVDAFVNVRRGDTQYVVRSSAPLSDRADLRVGPFRIEVLEPLRRLRFAVEPSGHPVELDVEFGGVVPATLEPRQFLRSKGRVVFDTQRLAQTGRYRGHLQIGGDRIALDPTRHWGNRDRSWGVRPVGEPEPGGIRAGDLVLPGLWTYAPMQFEDHSIFVVCHELDDGRRPLVQAERVWADPDRPADELGPVEHVHRFEPGTRVVTSSLLRFPASGTEIACTSLLANFISVGTGYGIDTDWRQGMYHGPEPVTQGLVLEVPAIRPVAQYGIVDHVARFECDGQTGFGLFEHGVFGPFRRYGMPDGLAGAPAR